MMRCRTAAMVFFLLRTAVMAGGSNEWPAVFTVPVKPDTAVDSAKLRLSSDAKVFKNTEKTSSRLEWAPLSSLWRMRQRSVVTTRNEGGENAMNQVYDFSGSVIRDSVFPKGGSLGLEWSPVINLELRDHTPGGVTATNDFGTVMQWRTHDIPLRFRGGISGSGWNYNLPARLLDNKYEYFHGDAGFYGAFSAGDPTVRLLGRPLYVTTEAFVRAVRMVGIAAINGSALLAHRLGSGDSLFAYYGDSLSNGKERYWGSPGGQRQYTYAPWRVARSFQATGGLKFRESRLRPALVYSYAENAVTFPNLDKPNDRRVMLQSIHLLGEAKSTLPVVYKGGIKIWWGAEEWLFKSDRLRSVADTFNLGPASTREDTLTKDSLTVKLSDHQIYRAATDHAVSIALPKGMALEYTLGIFRNSRTYTFCFSPDSVRNYNDDDAITLNHQGRFKLPRFRAIEAEAFGAYSVNITNYLKKEDGRSSENRTEDGYLLGLDCSYRPSERFSLSERITAEADIIDYFYKQSHLNDPPPYKRRFSSLCRGTWKMTDHWELHGRWDENYNDYGVWYGHEYLDTARADSLGTDYYAIMNKATTYSVELSLARVRDRYRLESGCRLSDVFARSYRENAYVIDVEEQGYVIEPFLEFTVQYRRFSLRGRVVRLVNTLASDNRAFKKNWDIHVAGQASW
ncbi:MAG: hypothetical protein JW699_06045 [Chitinispirillaceae bacterium]|nr:hypothetical protein [Chitinispirillaceae bacterium]